jgi:hypothetical protein
VKSCTTHWMMLGISSKSSVPAIDMSKKYDLAVAYRISSHLANGTNKSPIFPNDKRLLTELCLESFKRSLGDLKVKMYVLMDAPLSWDKMFQKLWNPEDLVIINTGTLGNRGSLYKQAAILYAQTDANLVYFAEDDYFFLPYAMQDAVDFIKTTHTVDFVSLYHHPDCDRLKFQRIGSTPRRSRGRNWFTTTATTHSFLTRKSVLEKTIWVWRGSHPKLWSDLADWLSVTKAGVFNPFNFTGNKFLFTSWLIAWFWNWRYILFSRKMRLVVPEYSLATHMASGLEGIGLGPSVWMARFKELHRDLFLKHFYHSRCAV